MMFNLSEIQKRNEKTVLQYFHTVDSSQVFSYADLYKNSIELAANIQNILRKSASSSAVSINRINVAVLLPLHSPALLPAIVG